MGDDLQERALPQNLDISSALPRLRTPKARILDRGRSEWLLGRTNHDSSMRFTLDWKKLRVPEAILQFFPFAAQKRDTSLLFKPRRAKRVMHSRLFIITERKPSN